MRSITSIDIGTTLTVGDKIKTVRYTDNGEIYRRVEIVAIDTSGINRVYLRGYKDSFRAVLGFDNKIRLSKGNVLLEEI